MKMLSLHLPRLAMIVCLLMSMTPGSAIAADFNITKNDNNKINAGQIFTVEVKIDTSGVLVNAAQAKIKFSSEMVQVKSISRDGSVFNFWLQEPSFSNIDGTIVFVGGTSKEISGNALKVFSITFASLKSGESEISFVSGAITSSDGTGEDVLVNANGAHFVISPLSKTSEINVFNNQTKTVQKINTPIVTDKKPKGGILSGSLFANIFGDNNDSGQNKSNVLGNIILILTLFNSIIVSILLVFVLWSNKKSD